MPRSPPAADGLRDDEGRRTVDQGPGPGLLVEKKRIFPTGEFGRGKGKMGSLIFVHGTGVRLADSNASIDQARQGALAAGLQVEIKSCPWGDPLGVMFQGRSLPDPPSEAELQHEATEEARWTWLFDDPLFELNSLTIRGEGAAPAMTPPGMKPKWVEAWERIAGYRPSQELALLLARAGVRGEWDTAWSEIVGLSDLPRRAFEASARENELADAVIALGRSLIARTHVLAVEAGRAAPSRAMREKLLRQIVDDWGYTVSGLGTFVGNLFLRAGTGALRRRRNKFSALSAMPIGDILLYQARGDEIRDFIRRKVEEAEPPVSLLAHSLGGIACFDLLAMAGPPQVARFVTIGSQAPYFYEIGALQSLHDPSSLPDDFPPWLNIYDRDDFLSFVGHRIFGDRVEDFEVMSGQPFPASHGAYLGNPEVWAKVARFLA